MESFLRQDKDFIKIEYKHYNQLTQLQFSRLYKRHTNAENSKEKTQLSYCDLDIATWIGQQQHLLEELATHGSAGIGFCKTSHVGCQFSPPKTSSLAMCV
jgi:hypothetical protein